MLEFKPLYGDMPVHSDTTICKTERDQSIHDSALGISLSLAFRVQRCKTEGDRRVRTKRSR